MEATSTQRQTGQAFGRMIPTELPPLPPEFTGEAHTARRVLGLSGYPGVGKDTVAKMLTPRGYQRIAFADPIRALAYDLDPAVHDQVDMLGWENAYSGNDYVRRYLQKLGQKAREHIDPGVWITAALRNIGIEGNYVITDVRYRNEAETLKNLGAKLVRVERPGQGPVNDHASEVEMDGYPFDAFLLNDGDLNQLFDRVMMMEEDLF